jgi:membrane-bound ClpP family serine protease
LRPAGVVVVAGKRLDVLAESGMIEAGSRIQVVAVKNNNVIVKQI